MANNVDEKESKGFRARFKKQFHSRSPGKAVIGGATAPPTPSVPRPTGMENIDKQTNLEIPGKKEDKRSRRQEAEDEFKAAAATLNQAMSKDRVQHLEALTLQPVGHIDNVEGTAQEIGNAIDKFIVDRQLKLTSGSKAVWKTCVKRWYMTAVPIMVPCLEAASVNLPFAFPSIR
jgi:hypothetical protein